MSDIVSSCVTNLGQKALASTIKSIMASSGASSLLSSISTKKTELQASISSLTEIAQALPSLINELGALALNPISSQVSALAERWGMTTSQVMSLLGNVCGAPNLEGSPNADGTYTVAMKASLAATPGGQKPVQLEPLGETSTAELPVVYVGAKSDYEIYKAQLGLILANPNDNSTLKIEKTENSIFSGLQSLKYRASSVGMDFNEYIKRYSSDVTSDEQGFLSRLNSADEERISNQKLRGELLLATAGFEKKLVAEPGRDASELRKIYDRTIESMIPIGVSSGDFVSRASTAGDKIQENEKVIRDYFQFGTQSGSASMTGFAASPGSRITSYGYERRGEAYFDTNSSNGIGIKDLRLAAGDFALSPDIRSDFESNGITHSQYVLIKLSNGTTIKGRWRDVTAKIHPQTGAPMRGRVDIYSPAGAPSYDGVSVVGFGILPADDKNLIASVRP